MLSYHVLIIMKHGSVQQKNKLITEIEDITY